MFRSGVLAKVMSFIKPSQIMSQFSVRGRIQEQTSDFSKFLLPFFFLKIKFRQHFVLSFTELTMVWRRYFNPLKETFYTITNSFTFPCRPDLGDNQTCKCWLVPVPCPCHRSRCRRLWSLLKETWAHCF